MRSYCTRAGDTIYFYEEGGVDVGDVDSKAHKLDIVIGTLSNLWVADFSSRYILTFFS